MKKVFSSNSQVCHVYASQSQSTGRSGSIFFEGRDIYSYGRHYLAARIYNVKGKKVCLINSKRYSSSTCKHLYEIEGAVSHMISMRVVSPSDPKTSLKARHAELAEHYFDFFSGRKFWQTGAEAFNGFSESVDEFNQLCDLFEFKRLKINLTKLHRDLWIEKAQQAKEREEATNTPEALEKKAANRLKRKLAAERLANAKASEAIAIWKNGGAMRSDLRLVRPQLIRIKGDQVETSGGASVPLSDAISLLNRIQKGKAKQGDRIGSFELNRVEQGAVVIGCHTISIAEAESVLSPVKLTLVQGGAK